ncbi:MAG: NifB/NifX family molybdenum-iron cluster-binding protein [Planctomycetota bacterium]
MKIAVTAAGAKLESPLDPRFGRCPYFLIVETEDLSFEAVGNPNVSRDSGAGIQAAQLVAEKGARFVITGNCGPNAYQTLSAAGLGVIVGCSGTVRDVIENFKAGRYSAATQANVASHFGTGPALNAAASVTVGPQAPSTFAPGMGGGFGRGMGRGMGRGGGGMGMGRGMGRGGGRGMGMGRGMGRGGAFASSVPDLQPQPAPQPQPDSAQELAVLKAQARAVEEQLANLNERMGQMQNATARRLVAVVDADQCSACGLCVQVCAAGAITVNGAAKIDVGKCTACGQCVAQCPQGAIALRKA